MTKLGGYAGNILLVDLSEGRVEKRPMPEELARKFIGNRGLNARLAYDFIKPGTEPLSPENCLIFGTGLFMGTMVPTAGRNDLTYRSPLSGFIAASSSGQSGMIKFAGYDNLVITGKADRPVYLRIHDDEVEIRDARHLWGKDTWETTDELRRCLGGDYNISVIGQAGENLYLNASIVSEKYGYHGQSGSGAVMGSKNLKAIVVKGTKSIQVADPKRFKKLIDHLYREFITNTEWVLPGTALDTLEEYRKLGSIMGFGLVISPAKNFQERVPRELQNAFSQDEFLSRIKEGDVTCMACPIACKHRLRMRDGKYSGLSYSASCVGAIQTSWGGHCLIDNYDEIIRCGELCARFGMDLLATGPNVAFALELYEKGIITKEDTGGLELKWGDAGAIQELIRKMAFREDIGDLLADGIREASLRIGKGSEDAVVQVKGLPEIMDIRSFFAPESFGGHTAIRGGHAQMWHCSILGMVPDKMEKFVKRSGIPEDALARILKEGAPGFNVPRFTRYNEDFQDLLNLLGICNKPFETVRHDIGFLAELYTALTGIEISPSELLRCGERAWNMQKIFNVREGASRKDDLPPKRILTEALNVPGRDGKPPFDEQRFHQYLTEYYEERGWDLDEGFPTREKLVELGLEDVAAKEIPWKTN